VCGRTDGQTDRHTADMTKLIVAFSQFCERPSNCYLLTSFVLYLRMLRNLYIIRLLYNVTVSVTCFRTNRTQVSTCCFLCTIEYREGFIDTDGFWTKQICYKQCCRCYAVRTDDSISEVINVVY